MDGYALGCLGFLIAAGLLGISVVLPISSAVRLQRALGSIADLRAQIRSLEARLTAMSQAAATAPVPARVEAPRAAAVEPAAAPESRPVPTAAVPIVATPGPAVPASEPGSAPPLPVTLPAVAKPTPVGRPLRRGDDTLETRIGGRWLLYIGTAAVIFGVGFFVKYAFDNAWITETGRVVLGALLGIVMVAAGQRFVRRGYELYGQVIAGGGFVAMYLSTWAALNLYGLVPRPAAFAVMVLITVGAAFMADRLSAVALASVAILGGFLTPALVGGQEDAQIVLFTYVTVLVAGTVFLAARHDWRWLNLASYALTLLTFAAWADEYYTGAKYLPTQFFLTLLGSLFAWVYFIEWRRTIGSFRVWSGVLLGSVPLLFHLASVANLVDHSLALLVYTIVVTLAGVMLSVRADRAWIRLTVFVAVTPVFLLWLDGHTSQSWLAAAIVALVAQYVMYLAAAVERLFRKPDPWPRADLVLFHGNALALFAGLYMVVDVHSPYSTPLLAIALAAWQAVLAWRARALSGEAAVNGLAAAFAMLGFAIGLQFDDWWALVGWAVEAGAIYWAGLRTLRPWMRIGGVILLVAVLARLVTMDFFATPAGFAVGWNPRVGATAVVIAVIYAMAWFFRRTKGAAPARDDGEYAALLVGANVLTLLLLSVEINSYWHIRTADDATASFSLLASLSIAWGLYGTGLVTVGIQRRYAPLRYLAIVLLLLTVAKVFLIDLSELGGIYRIVGFMGLGVFLLLGAWLYQRYRDIILGNAPEE